jgi:hypothetical protein
MSEQYKADVKSIAKMLHDVGLHRAQLTKSVEGGRTDLHGRSLESNDRLKCALMPPETEAFVVPLPVHAGQPLDWLVIFDDKDEGEDGIQGDSWIELLAELDRLETEGPTEHQRWDGDTYTFDGNETAEAYCEKLDGTTPRIKDGILFINGVPAPQFIKEAFGLGKDLSGPGRYDQKDPVQQALRNIRDWVRMAEHDALESRNAGSGN